MSRNFDFFKYLDALLVIAKFWPFRSTHSPLGLLAFWPWHGTRCLGLKILLRMLSLNRSTGELDANIVNTLLLVII